MPKSTNPANESTGFYISHILIQRVKVSLSCAERIVALLLKKAGGGPPCARLTAMISPIVL